MGNRNYVLRNRLYCLTTEPPSKREFAVIFLILITLAYLVLYNKKKNKSRTREFLGSLGAVVLKKISVVRLPRL